MENSEHPAPVSTALLERIAAHKASAAQAAQIARQQQVQALLAESEMAKQNAFYHQGQAVVFAVKGLELAMQAAALAASDWSPPAPPAA